MTSSAFQFFKGGPVETTFAVSRGRVVGVRPKTGNDEGMWPWVKMKTATSRFWYIFRFTEGFGVFCLYFLRKLRDYGWGL